MRNCEEEEEFCIRHRSPGINIKICYVPGDPRAKEVAIKQFYKEYDRLAANYALEKEDRITLTK